jgi:hypothetical protein
VLSETAAPPPPVAGAPDGTADGLTAGAVAAVVGVPVWYSSASLLLGLLVWYSLASLLLVGFAAVHGGGVTQVDGAAAAVEGFEVEAALLGLLLELEPPFMVIPGMSAPIELPGAMFMPGIESLLEDEDGEEELLEELDVAAGLAEDAALLVVELELPALDAVELGFGESLVHGGAVTHVDGAAAEDVDEVAVALGLALADGVSVAVGTIAGGTSTGAPAGGAPAGGTPAPAVEEVESLPDLRPISDSTIARSTIATSAPMTQAVLFGLSLSDPV